MRRTFGLTVLGLGAGLFAGTALTLRPPPGPVPPEPGFVLRDVTVLRPGAKPRPGVTLRGAARITDIAPSAPGEAGPYSGRYVLPGLVDLHVHHPPRLALGERELFGLLFLAHGVTTVRDAGAIGGDLRGLRRAREDGDTAGPRLFVCGPPLDAEPVGWYGARVVEGPLEAREAVLEQAAGGYDCIKVYNGLVPDALRAVEEAAAGLGLTVVGHVPDQVPFREVRSIEVQHLMGLAHSRWDEIPEELVDWYVEHSARNELSHVPTLVAIARWATLDDAELEDDPVGRLLPPHYREAIWKPALNPLVGALAPSQGSEAAARVALMRNLVRRLADAGVTILVGTDTMNPFVVPGAALHEELAHLEAAGLSADEVLEAATSGAARALGRRDLGRVEVGAGADLLVLREDPTRDLAALATLEAVVVSGRLYRHADLAAAIDARLAHWERPVVRGFWGAVSRTALAWLRRSHR